MTVVVARMFQIGVLDSQIREQELSSRCLVDKDTRFLHVMNLFTSHITLYLSNISLPPKNVQMVQSSISG